MIQKIGRIPKSTRHFSLTTNPKNVIKHDALFINGKYYLSRGTQVIESIDPKTEMPNYNMQAASNQDIDFAVESARNAFDKGPWPRMSGYERSQIMHKIADLLENKADMFAKLETIDVGMPFGLSRYVVID